MDEILGRGPRGTRVERMKPEVNAYVIELDSLLRVSRRRRERTLEDSREHLEDGIDAALGAGLDERAATAQAIGRYGEPQVVARHVNADFCTSILRRAPISGLSLAVVVLAALVLAAHSSPSHASAGIVTRVLFSTAVAAGEVALAAGILLVLRLVESSRERAIGNDDAQLARRTGLVLFAGEAAAAVLLMSAIAANKITRGSIGPNLIISATVMVLAGAAAFTLARRMYYIAPVGVEGPPTAISPLPGELAHRAFAVVGRFRAASCAVVAAVAAYGALGHAETALPGSLWWAGGQALVVVVGFLSLGGYLGLRHDETAGVGV